MCLAAFEFISSSQFQFLDVDNTIRDRGIPSDGDLRDGVYLDKIFGRENVGKIYLFHLHITDFSILEPLKAIAFSFLAMASCLFEYLGW